MGGSVKPMTKQTIKIFSDLDNTLIPKFWYDKLTRELIGFSSFEDIKNCPTLFDYLFTKLYSEVDISGSLLFHINSLCLDHNFELQFFIFSRKYTPVAVQAFHELVSKFRKEDLDVYPIVDNSRVYSFRQYLDSNTIIIHDTDVLLDEFCVPKLLIEDNHTLHIQSSKIRLDFSLEHPSMYKLSTFTSDRVEFAIKFTEILENIGV